MAMERLKSRESVRSAHVLFMEREGDGLVRLEPYGALRRDRSATFSYDGNEVLPGPIRAKDPTPSQTASLAGQRSSPRIQIGEDCSMMAPGFHICGAQGTVNNFAQDMRHWTRAIVQPESRRK